jgi:hypothetical protein
MDKKPPEPKAQTAATDSTASEPPAVSPADGAQAVDSEAQQVAVDQMLTDLIDDPEKAALYHLLSIC